MPRNRGDEYRPDLRSRDRRAPGRQTRPAEPRYPQILDLDTGQTEALRLLGYIACDWPNYGQCIERVTRAMRAEADAYEHLVRCGARTTAGANPCGSGRRARTVRSARRRDTQLAAKSRTVAGGSRGTQQPRRCLCHPRADRRCDTKFRCRDAHAVNTPGFKSCATAALAQFNRSVTSLCFYCVRLSRRTMSATERSLRGRT